jgi:peptidyl-Lys metalloendopeptidase
MHLKRLAYLIVAGVILTRPLCAQSPESRGLKVDLNVATPEVHAQGPLTIRFTLTNTSDGELAVLKWHTPLDGIRSDMFLVERDGVPAPYLGVLVKRGAPTAEDVVILPKGGSVSATVDLFKAYAISEPGDYTVQFQDTLFIVRGGKAGLSKRDHGLAPAAPKSSPTHFKLLEPRTPPAAVLSALNAPRRQPEPLQADPKASLSFDQCSAAQISVLTDAHDHATQLAAYGGFVMLLGALTGKPSVPYLTWFGAYDKARFDQVLNNFNVIYSALAHEQSLRIICADRTEDNCTPLSNVIAFVYPSRAYDIHVCPLYWKIPPTGMDSQADTLVHEVSHFNVVAKTSDFAYGAPACRSLALSDPVKAIANADSYGYFSDEVGPTP